ncbi:DUF6388 family protein [Pseudomonas sp. W2Jun17]|uniref:DUF6388 family protein n=1 Tax=Pseudomonas sp. W2Jun17 TaxID=1553460 RepID=UPI002006B41B|nr:DUF6388 family protein [Pseudomonas sp. W2Jun17]MCK3852695.1 hypothetical protein [Pseudomonas sp. W2Jun17]
MTTRNEIQTNAIIHIFETHPELIREIEALSDDEFSPFTREQYRSQRLEEALAKEAKQHRISWWGYQLKLAEQAGMDVSAFRDEDRHAEAGLLGIDKFF